MNRSNNSLPGLSMPGRIQRRQAVTRSQDGRVIELCREQVTLFHPDGTMDTTETIYSVIVQGEKVTSHLQLAGQCQNCHDWVTHRAVRYCTSCGLVLCAMCAEWWEQDHQWVCENCLKRHKRKRLWRRLGRIVVGPFVEKI